MHDWYTQVKWVNELTVPVSLLFALRCVTQTRLYHYYKSINFTTGDEWKISPLIIYDENSVLDPQNISLKEVGKTVHFTCIASVGSGNDSMVILP